MAPPVIETWQLIAFSLFIVLSSAISIYMRLNLEKDLWIGAVRTFIQLFFMGFVLKFVFNNDNLFFVLGLFIWMLSLIHI